MALDIHPIIESKEQKQLFEDLERVEFKIADLQNEKPKTNLELTQEAAKHERVLLITDKRNSAKEIYEELEKLKANEKESNFHLSALMCPAHREKTLEEIKGRLKTICLAE